MKRLMTLGLAVPATVAIAACGGSSGSGGTSSAPASNPGSKTVAVQQLSGVGRVLVDDAGKPLYSSNLEAGGKIVCDGACNAFWTPLTVSHGQPTAATGTGKLGVIARPDGARQVTADGKPLYTFSEDSSGKATGNGFTDDFSGHHFTWKVIHPGGVTISAAGSGNGPNTSSTGSYGGGY